MGFSSDQMSGSDLLERLRYETGGFQILPESEQVDFDVDTSNWLEGICTCPDGSGTSVALFGYQKTFHLVIDSGLPDLSLIHI